MHRRLDRRTVAAIAAVVAAACTQMPVTDSSPTSGATPSTATSPAPAERVAVEAEVAAAPLPDEVPLHKPDLRADGIAELDLAAVAAIEGVEYAVEAARLEVSARTPDGLEPVDALVMDPETFRPMTPDITAFEPGVWERLNDGNVVLTPAAGNTIGALLGEPMTFTGPRASEALRVGAFAANGLPPAAEMLVPWQVGRRLGADAPDTLLVAVADDADVGAVREAIADTIGGEVAVIEEPAEQEVRTQSVGTTTLEAFTYQSVGDGTIKIDPAWVSRNIVSADVPILGRVTCHRIMIDQLAAALREIEAAGLGNLIYDYSGCYVPRHLLWDPNRGISRHAWGLAFDINVPTNGYGQTPTLDLRIVEIFRSWGFKWGGDFATPDGMHFELERVVTPS